MAEPKPPADLNTEPPSNAHPDVSELLGELRRRAAQRRDDGTYPVGVVRRFHRLAEDLARRAAPLPLPDPAWGGLRRDLQAAGRLLAASGGPEIGAYVSSVDSAVAYLVERVELLEHAQFRSERLVERLERLEREEERRGFVPWFTNETFAAHFRGTRQEVLDAYADVAAMFDGCAPVADLGSGRTEFVELLRARGVDAYGVESDPDLVAHAHALGLPVQHGDAIGHLRTCADGVLGGVSMLQVIEHLTPQEQLDAVRLCAQKVRTGGRVVVESVNPQSLYVYTHALYLDPTHTRPVHPLYLEFLFLQAGFTEVQLHWRSPVPEEDRIDYEAVGPVGHPVRSALERAAFVLGAPQDFVVVATR